MPEWLTPRKVVLLLLLAGGLFWGNQMRKSADRYNTTIESLIREKERSEVREKVAREQQARVYEAEAGHRERDERQREEDRYQMSLMDSTVRELGPRFEEKARRQASFRAWNLTKGECGMRSYRFVGRHENQADWALFYDCDGLQGDRVVETVSVEVDVVLKKEGAVWVARGP